MRFFKKKPVSTVTPLVTSNENIQQESGSRPVSAHSRISHHSVNVPTTEHVIVSQKVNCCRRCCTKSNLKEQALLLATVISVVLGVIVGVSLRGLKCPDGKIIELKNRIKFF